MWWPLCSTGKQFCLESPVVPVQEQALKHLSIPESLSCSQAQLSLRKGLRIGQTAYFPSWPKLLCPLNIVKHKSSCEVKPFPMTFPEQPQSLGRMTNSPSSLCHTSPQPHAWHWGFSLECSQSSTFWVVSHSFSSNANTIGSLGTRIHSFH